jgi:hypothetical protein
VKLSILSAAVLIIISVLAVGARAEKIHVCSITLNSNDEIELLKKRLDPYQYEFREFVPQNKDGKYVFGWFNKACESNYRCDVLLISGHFGGHFFGETSPYILDIEQMHRASCQQTCTNILNAPKEIFLFGCNTLASKERGNDGRNFDSYYNVLLDHGYSNQNAFSIANMRFSPIASTFGEKMRQIFVGRDTKIMGFSFVSPLGPVNARLMDTSLNSTANAFSSDQFVDDLFNRYNEKKVRFTKAYGISTTVELHQNKLICQLNDRLLDVESKFTMIEELLSAKNYLQSLPAALFILNSFEDLNPKQFRFQTQKVIESLKANTVIQNHLERVLPDLVNVPDSYIEVLKTMARLGWLSDYDLREKFRETINRLNNSKRSLDGDFLCLIQAKNQKVFEIVMGADFVQRRSCKNVTVDTQFYTPSEFFGRVKVWDDLGYLKQAYKDRSEDLAHAVYLLKNGQSLDGDYMKTIFSNKPDKYISPFHLYEVKIDRVFTKEEREVISEVIESASINQWGKAFVFVTLIANNNFISDQEMRQWLTVLEGNSEIYKTLRSYLLAFKNRYPLVLEY